MIRGIWVKTPMINTYDSRQCGSVPM
eukprot:SAG11_NODE_5932_length_1430_cov_1.725770_1_plen_25_part_10